MNEMENLFLKPTLLSQMGIADKHLQFLYNTVNRTCTHYKQ